MSDPGVTSESQSKQGRPPPPFLASPAACWLPRTLCVSLIVASLLAGLGLADSPGAQLIRGFLLLIGLFLGWVVLRQGAEIRQRFKLDDDKLIVWSGKRSAVLRIAEIERIDFLMPFERARQFLPATSLEDRFGRTWRISGLISDGDRLIARLLRAAGRSDLEGWAEALHVGRRMSRARAWIVVGYTVAALIPLGAALLALGGDRL